MNIRPYSHADFDMISSWWTDARQCPPTRGSMVSNGSFILELGGTPALSLTVFLTQSEIAYFEGFIKNPSFKSSLEDAGQALWDHCFSYAKSAGYSRVVCYCAQEKLVNKYKRFGMSEAASGLTSFVREL